jgi:ubiquinone/menaquinone biosynthesis C-methylase UbiE
MTKMSVMTGAERAPEAQIELVSTDVSRAPLTVIICDSHDSPFDNETFDGAIVQIVLEHVVNPNRCVVEIGRVLRPQGIGLRRNALHAQVHLGTYEFTRFTRDR